CLLLIAGWVRRETNSGSLGLVAAGLFAATFRASGAWLDIARVDSLCLLLFLAGAWFLRFAPSPQGMAGAGVLLGLSFLTKPTALVMAAPLVLATFHRSRRSGLILLGTFGFLIAGSSLLLERLSGGWYHYYVFDLPRHHGWS